MKLKLIILDAANFYMGNLAQIAKLCLPWLIAAALVEYAIAAIYTASDTMGPMYLLSWFFNLLVYPIYTSALIMLMAERANQQRPANRQLIASAIRIWQPFFIVHVMGAGLTALGLMLFILPGIYAAVRLSFAEFFLVLDNLKPVEAIQKSFEATRSHFGLILLLMVIFITPLLLISIFLSNLLHDQGAGPLVNILVATVTAFLMLFVDVVLFRVYMSATRENPA
jgi:hypothetical protein